MVKEQERDILSFQIQRNISALCKHCLNILEDLQAEYDRYFDKSKVMPPGARIQLPPEMFLSNDHFEHLRKRVLDKGGDLTRDLLDELNKYDVRLLTNEELQKQTGGQV